ncbi:M48 family metallopeptidase [Pleionea sp. CnH1-48]|uniref:tetratricopeptide repeat protein n=1 Tax=Pleionea sp. CnH1-48 TaxID=2954494 RepID=UPI00209840D0|nr:hypothetical protein [Pleionea sp. CnH1-48]MCO7226309.1 hypothetical protein [Pleionea sp. CnH1-48]
MSVVNQMLKDLDKQHPSNAALKMDAVPTEESGGLSKKTFLVILLGLVGVVLLVLFYLDLNTKEIKPINTQSMVTATIDENASKPLTETSESNDQENILVKTEVSHKPVVQLSEQKNQQKSKQETVGEEIVKVSKATVSLSQEATTTEEPVASIAQKTKPQSVSPNLEKAKPSINNAVVNVKSQESLSSAPLAKEVKSLSVQELKKQKLDDIKRLMLIDSARAVGDMQQLLTLYPDYHQARETYALYLISQSQQDKALIELETGVRKYPDNVTYRMLLARLYVAKKQWSQVQQVLAEPASSRVPDDFLILKAVASQQLTEHEQAVSLYSRLLTREQQRGEWWIGIAISLEALKRHQEAYKAYHQALRDSRLSSSQKRFAQQKLVRLKVSTNA